jgi:hypothetical protein
VRGARGVAGAMAGRDTKGAIVRRGSTTGRGTTELLALEDA